MKAYMQAVQQQASYRGDGTVPDFETYISERRETSACKPAFDLVEYGLDMELPEYVVKHPVILTLNQSANDLVSWANVSAAPSSLPAFRVLKEGASGYILLQLRTIIRRDAQLDQRSHDT
jgi:hypothetical protein